MNPPWTPCSIATENTRPSLTGQAATLASSSGLAQRLLEDAFRLLEAGSLQLSLPSRQLFTKLLKSLGEPLLGDWEHLALFLGRRDE
jgi:hypothetical protein